ncbi:MAG: 1-phosphofructokinase family hexose kinase, partial [Bacteroidota bacterium]|nr:1-phosphofructokinase family hexose kinase [Bacteroidota bacterium]
MPSIVTITLNPCIDKSTTIASLKPEKKLRCTQPVFEPGGGGINVARAIHKLGGEVAAIYPSGGYSGKFLNILIEKEGVYSKVIETREHTRENLIVLDKASNLQYRFGMPGQELQEDEWISCMEMVRSAAATYVVASGSLPPGVPDDILAQIAGISREVGSRFVVDSSGIALKLALEKGAYLMKPNI